MQGRASKKSKRDRDVALPTPAEMRLLQILWRLGEATVEEVVTAHPVRERPNYKTTQTLLRTMERKGFITHESRGRMFVFTCLVNREVIDRHSVQALLRMNFSGSTSGLLINLLGTSHIREEELDELEAYIREHRKRNEQDRRKQE